jgi:hypothetical protein
LNAEGVTADVSVDAGTGNVREVTLSNIVGTGTIGISVVAGTAKDKAGLLVAALGLSNTVKVDTNVPTIDSVTIYSNNANPIYAKNGDIITLEFVASEIISEV